MFWIKKPVQNCGNCDWTKEVIPNATVRCKMKGELKRNDIPGCSEHRLKEAITADTRDKNMLLRILLSIVFWVLLFSFAAGLVWFTVVVLKWK